MSATIHTSDTDAQAIDQALTEAATLARHAPSIHNTQPWRWRLSGDELDLYLEKDRLLTVTDPDSLLATLSCGAALHHAQISLAAGGWHTNLTRMPDLQDPTHLAHIRIHGRQNPSPQAQLRVQTIQLRHTDRRPVSGTSISPQDLADITAAVEAEGTWLHVLRPEQLYDLAAATDHAQRTEASETQWREELAVWTGGTRPEGTGIPGAAIPASNPQTPLPGRDFGHPGTLPVSTAHDKAAVFVMLYGDGDQPQEWLRAGEALSAAWLTAAERGISVLPLSAPMEVTSTREVMRQLVSRLGYPYLVLRLGVADPADPAMPHVPRLPAEQIIQRPSR
jgi:nitroreductase